MELWFDWTREKLELIGRRDFTFVENDLNTLRGGAGPGFEPWLAMSDWVLSVTSAMAPPPLQLEGKSSQKRASSGKGKR